MKLKLRVLATKAAMGMCFLSLTGAGILMVETSLAQSSIDGSWATNGGSWGNLTLWSYGQSARNAVMTANLNAGPAINVVRRHDKLEAIELLNVPGAGGSGYTVPPTVIVSDPGANGRPAVVQANISTSGPNAGQITGFTVLDEGAGYTGTITATVTREVSGVLVADQGSGYTKPPRIAFNGGGSFTSPPTVSFRGGLGGGAVAQAVVTNVSGSNRVTSINIINGGSGYDPDNPPPISFVSTAGGGSAAGTPVINGSGQITAITITNQGSGYNIASPPGVVIGNRAPTEAAIGTAIVQDGRVVGVEINDSGKGYTFPPQVIFSGGGAFGNGGVYARTTISNGEVDAVIVEAPFPGLQVGGGANGAIATANFHPDPEIAKFGAIDSLTLNSGGQGYTSVPTVTVGAQNITTATATAVVNGSGTVTAINVGNPGSGYIATPAVSISTGRWLGYTAAPRVRFVSGGVTGAVASATINATTRVVTGLSVVDGGGGYVTAPTVTIVGGNGNGATATAAVSGGVVTAVNVTNQGSDYGVTPTVIFTGGGGTGAKATANRAANRVTSITITDPGSGYTSAPTVSIIAGDVANPATATAIIATSGANAGRVTGLTLDTPGSGYTSTPSVLFTSGGVTFGTATATVASGRLTRITLTRPGNGYVSAPTVNLTTGILAAGTHGTATATVSGGKINDDIIVNTPGGADPASAVAVLAPDGTVGAVNVTSGGNGYISAPTLTIAAPTGVATPVLLGPGGTGSFIQFNRDITGNSTITLEDARKLGSLSIGDTGGEDYTFNSGTGGIISSLTFSMGAIGGGKSFLNKLQGDQDVINAPVVIDEELNARINAGRLTLAGGITGDGSLTLSGNAVLTVRGNAPISNPVDLWLWNRGFGNAGPQIELASTGGPAFDNIRLGNASMGTGGHAVLQLLQGRSASQLDQIRDNATIIVDAVTNRWGYFKLMGGNETIGNILDVGNALVLENMEGETVNTDAMLTLGGNNLDSYIGGFIRNRSGGSGTGTLGIIKNGTGDLTLFGGNITYTGDTILNGGSLRLTNTTSFNSRIIAANGTLVEVETTGAVNFDNDVIGDTEFRKLGNSSLSFNSGRLSLQDFFMTSGTTTVRAGASTLFGGRNEIDDGFTVLGDGGLNKTVRIADSLSVGFVSAEGRFGQTGSLFDIFGERLSVSSRGYFRDGVLESSGPIEITNMAVRLLPQVISDLRTVQNNVTNTNLVTLNDVNNLLVGSIFTLREGTAAAANRVIPPDTRIVAINPAARVVELSKNVTIVAGTEVTFTYTSQTDGAIRGESLNFADVVHDGRKFIAVTKKGTIHTSLNGTVWTAVYVDPAEIPLQSLSWTGGKLVAVGEMGRVLTSTDGTVWALQNSGIVTSLNGITSTQATFTGNLAPGSAVVSNVTGGTSFLPGMPVNGNATPPDARIVSVSVTGSAVSIVMDGAAIGAGTGVDFSYFTGNTTTVPANATTVSNVRTAQNLPIGAVVTSSATNGIPANATIIAKDGPNSTMTLSANANLSQASVDLFTLTGNTSAGSKIVNGLSNTAGLAVGMIIKGTGIPVGSRIAAIDVGASSITLSETVTVARSNLPLSVFTGRLVSGSPVVQDVTSATSFTVGMLARGLLFPLGTVVQSSTADTVTLSNQSTATATAATLRVVKTLMTRTGNFTASNATVTAVSDTSGLAVGMPVSAPGVIPDDTVIQSIGSGTITLSKQALGSPNGQAFKAGFDLVAVGDGGRILASAGGGTNTWVNLPTLNARKLNAITWNGTQLVVVGENGEIQTSTTGLTWARQTPPLAAEENVMLTVGSTSITLTNPAVSTQTNVSFGAMKGDTTAGSTLVSNVTGIHALYPGLQMQTASNVYQAGTTVRSVDAAARSIVLSAPATATQSVPIRTSSGLVAIGSNVITEVTSFKGLMVGMSIHSLPAIGASVILELDPANKRIVLDGPSTITGRTGFGFLYGDAVAGSATMTNVRGTPSLLTLNGRTAHLTVGKSVGDYPGRIGSGVTISAFSSTANTLNLSAPALGTGYVPLYTISGTTTNGSNLITGVAVGSFTGLNVGQLIYVAGSANPTSIFNTFIITGLNSSSGEITLSSAPDLNSSDSPTVVSIGVFTGLVTSGQTLVQSLSNRLGLPAPLLYHSNLQDVIWTGTQYVAVGSYGAILTSADGITWAPRNSTTGFDLYTVGVSGTQLLAAGEDGVILKSPDGTAWSVARPADEPAFHDVRKIDDIQAVVSTASTTLALGSGGLSSVDGNVWSNSVNDTFSGTQTSLVIGGRIGQGGLLNINNEVTTSPTTTAAGGPLTNFNNPNRIGDTITLQSRGGTFVFENNAANAVFSETIGKLLLDQGQMQIQSFQAGLTGTNTLTFGSLEIKPGATVEFLSRDKSSGGAATLLGSIGEGVFGTLNVARNRIFFTQAPTMDHGIVSGAVTIDNQWAFYDATNGLRRLHPDNDYDTGDQTGWVFTDNVKMRTGRTLGGAKAINSLVMEGQTLNLNSRSLSIESGGLLVTGTAVIQGTSANQIAGNLTVGSARDAEAVLNIINPSQLTLFTQIQDFTTTATIAAHAINSTTLNIPAASMIGLVPGMEVTGGGAAIPAGTRILSVDTGNNRITLNVPTAAAIPVNTIIAFTGGSVSLAKSGGGLLLLNGNSTYTGKTYLNNGTVRITNIEALGTAPSTFVQDHIQINGGTLQINHVLQGGDPEPDYNLTMNDGLRGLTIGIAGGRIEVGTANPDNASSGTKVPQINFTITNPINAIGMLELAVRASSGFLPPQTNSITLGSPSSTNVYRAGIKTEAGFDGAMIIRGNNLIGGIFSEGGKLTLEGNNDFTAPIRSLTGDITITGSNTWKGGNTFLEPLSFSGGRLLLNSATALGSGGLNLAMGSAAELALAGISQKLRYFTSAANSVISNEMAPDNFTGFTPVIFDMDRNQTFAGVIKDGRSVSQSVITPLKLIKQGPATLNLTNAGNQFSAGIEILEGSINVTSASNVGTASALGIVATDDPALLIIDKSSLSFTPADTQFTNRSFTMGTGPNGATLVAMGAIQAARITIGQEFRDAISGTTSISTPIAFKGSGPRTLTLSGTGRGDNMLLLELGDSQPSDPTGLFKASSGNWVVGKANPYSGLTTVQEGNLGVTQNDALGTKGQATIVNQGAGTFTGNLPNGTPVSFPLFAATTLPGGIKADTQYYVVNASGGTFRVSTTPGGAPIALSTTGANVQWVPKIDSVRSTVFNEVTDFFTGVLPNGATVTFNTKLVPGVTTPLVPAGMVTNTPYYVVNSDNGTFQVSATLGGPPLDFSSSGTPNGLFYTTNAIGNAGAGVNLVGGSLDLRNVNYITPEKLIFEGGTLGVPADSTSSWAGDILVNANSRITIGTNGTLTLSGNLLGNRTMTQEGEGTLRLTGEALAPLTNLNNANREFVVRAGTLALDYSLNEASKLVDNARLWLGGTRRGGTVILSGGSHEEIISELRIEAGASKIFRESGTSTIRLNNVIRSTGSSLYFDSGRIAKVDNPNFNGILGAWAIIRDAITNAFWVIPGTSSFSYTVTPDDSNDFLFTAEPHVVRNGMIVHISSTAALPGGLSSGIPYYVVNSQGSSNRLKVSATLNGPAIDLTTSGSGTITINAELGFQANAASDTMTTVDAHGLANGVRVRVSSYRQLPGGLMPNTDYFVVGAEPRNFRLSHSINGPAINLTTNGSGAHVLETQGQRRSAPAALTFTIKPEFAPASDGNDRVRVAIQHVPLDEPISATLTGSGTTMDPYIYTIFTKAADGSTSRSSNQAIAAFVNSSIVGQPDVTSFLQATTSPNAPSGVIFPGFSNLSDAGNFGAPTSLANGSYDNGSQELDWASNAGVPGSPSTLNDGFVMPSASYNSGWSSTINTAVTNDINIASAISSTYSVRFANQIGATVSLLNTGLNSIRTGGILVSPTVGANDSTFTGTGRLTTENQGNLQNLMLHQYNTQGSLVINNKITDRLPIARAARLTGQSRRYLSMNVSLAGTQVAPDWSLPVTTNVNTGIAANTRVESFVQNRLIILGSNHDGVLRTQVYAFASPGSIAINADEPIAVGHPARNQITGLSTTADLTVGMSVQIVLASGLPGAGGGLTPGTTIAAILDDHTVLLNQPNDATFRVNTYSFSDGLTVINRAGLTNDPNRFLITGMLNTTGVTVGMPVAGPGIAPGTTVVEVFSNPAYVRLSQKHDGVHRVAANYTFDGSINMAGTLPLVVALPGSSSDPNRRILDGVSSTQGIIAGTSVTGAGIPVGTTVELVLDAHTLYLSQYHDGAFRRGNYSFAGGTLPPGGTVRVASVPNADRRIIMGVVIPSNGLTPSSVSTTDLYIGMPISGPGIPFGSIITFIYNDSDIQVSTNHFFTAESTSLSFTPSTGVEKLGGGLAVLNAANDYTGVTFIADGILRANLLTDGGVPGSLGASNAGSGNLVFNGGELQYVGENSQTNRGFTVNDFATINVGHERTKAVFSGSISSGQDRLIKDGPGTLEINGNANLAAMRVEQGRLLLQSVDTNPAPGAFSANNFSQSALTSLILGGGTLELRGAPEGNITSNFGSQLTIDTGSTILKVTSVPAADELSLTAPITRLNLMGQEEITPVLRKPGGSVHFVENPESLGAADIFLYLPTEERLLLLPWATYENTSQVGNPGVNHFATVLQATTSVDTTGGEVVSADSAFLYNIGTGLSSPNGWSTNRNSAKNLNVSEGALGENGPLAFSGETSSNRYANILRYATPTDGVVTINSGHTLELVGGAILAAKSVYQGNKSIMGTGNITGGALNDKNSDFIMHNYNDTTAFTIGANIVDRTSLAANAAGTVGKGTLKAGEDQMKINITSLPVDFFTTVRPGMRVSGPGIQPGTLVEVVEQNFNRLILTLPADSNQTNQVYTFSDTTNFLQVGIGTTILAGHNTYTGNTYVHGGVLRLDSVNAIPGGIAATGGTSAIIVEDGIIGLGHGDFNRPLGSGISQVQFTGNGGFAAYGGARTVNLGGAPVPETLRFGNNGFVPDGSSLILGSKDATHKLTLVNPIDLSAFSQAIRVENSPIPVEAELTGSLSGLGRMIKFGLGTLRLSVSNANRGGIEIAEGRLIAANVTDVFGASTGAVRLGTSLTNTTPRAGVDLEIEGGTVANPFQVGAINARGAEWVSGGTVESTQATNNIGSEASAAVVSGYPAIAYYDATNQDLKYVRALDPRGASWGIPVTISSRGNVGRNPSLAIINGNPAITYHDQSAGTLMYVRATDAQGVTWGTPISVLGQTSPVAVAVDSLGRIIVGGSFTRFDGILRNRLVRLNTDGSLDPTFNANIMNGEVRAIMILPSGKILVGGSFTAVRQTSTSTSDIGRNRIAVFNTDGTLDTSFDPSANGDVRLFVTQPDGKIMVGGAFTTISGVGRTRLARLNANITLDTSFGNTDIRNGEVRAIIPEDTDPSIAGIESYAIAGTFTSVRGDGNRNRLARINNDATLAAGFNPNANNNVLDMVQLPSGKFLIGGAFTVFADTIARTRLARLNNDGSVDETFGQEVNGEVRDLHLEGNGDVLVSGVFSRLGDFDRNFLGRILVDGTVDSTFAPEPDNEVRDMRTLPDGKIVLGGSFNAVGGITQQLVSRLLVNGTVDVGFSRSILNVGLYTSLYSVNGNPAIAYHNAAGDDIFYIRANDANGAGWPNPELIDSTGTVGIGISLSVANLGGDLLIKDNRGTETTDDDEVTLSGTPANIGTPVIAYGDATNSRIKYVVANNVNGTGNVGVGLGAAMTNWSPPVTIPGTGNVGTHFTLSVVERRPAIAYQTSDTKDLKYIRALNPAGITHNLRDPDTLAILRIFVSALEIRADTSWDTPVTLDSAGDVGSYPSLALVNGRPTTSQSRPAVSYYDATNGDLKYVTSADFTGAAWNAPTTLVSIDDVGRGNTLLVTDGLPAVAYYNVTSTDLGFVILNNASGYSRVAFTNNTTLTGNVTLSGTAMFSPAAGTTAQIAGALSGDAGLRLVGGGTLNLTGLANTFGAALARPGVTTGPGSAVDGAAIIRSGTLLVGSSGALGNATVELGDIVPQLLTANRATDSKSVLSAGGVFNAIHDGLTVNVTGPGAFVGVNATIDGLYLGLTASEADPDLNRFTGNLANGTAIRFHAVIFPDGIEGGLTYYVRGSNGTNFQLATTPTGAAVDINSVGNTLFFIEESKLATQILVKDESAQPEQNGVYRPIITPDNSELKVGTINLVRVAALDTAAEMSFGVRVNVTGGSSLGKAFFLGSTVTDMNVSAVHWIEEVAGGDVSLLTNVSGVTISNAIDVNAIPGSAATILGTSNTLTSGSVLFSGPISLQNLAPTAQDAETLRLISNTSTNFGVRMNGPITEASSQDMLSLVKTGSGIVTLGANNTFKGGISINEGALLVMNTPALPTDSGTGTGTVTVSAGTSLGGIGTIAGAVSLTGSSGSPAVLRPGDPTADSASVETLTINAPLTVGPDSVVEFTLGAINMTKLAGTSINLNSATSKILVQLASGFNPIAGAEFDILDFTSFTVFGGASNLLNLLQLPVNKVWDTTQFLTNGVLKVVGDPAPVVITDDPDAVTAPQGGTATFTVTYTGTGPFNVQWLKNNAEILGATSNTLTLSNLTQDDEAQYSVRVSNQVNPTGVVSASAVLLVDWPLSFARNLTAARTASVSYPLALKVIMNGEGPITYEWQKNSVPPPGAASWQVIPGSPSSDTFTIASAATQDAGQYRVLVKGPFQPAGILSAVTTVNVTANQAAVIESPESQTVLAGVTVTLNALPGGDNNARVTAWRRNGTAIPGEFTNTLILPGITVAQAGEYSFRVDNKIIATGKASTAVSELANIVVVENPNRIVAGQIGKTIKLTALVGSPSKVKPTYQWLKNGGPLPADGRFVVATNSLTIRNLVLTDTDTYTCRVTGAAGTDSVVGATHFVRVYDQAPEIVKTTPPPAGMVGSFYSWKIPVTSDVAATIGNPRPGEWEGTPATYAVRGLPAGLRLDPVTGLITGRPTAASKVATGDSITFTVTNAYKPTDAATTTWTTVLKINPLPAGIAGVFAGPVQRSATLNGSLGGRFDMTVTSAGAFSGRLTLGSDAPRSFTGAFALNFDGAGALTSAPTTSFVIPGTKTAPPVTLNFTLTITPAVLPEPPTTILTSATIAYRADSVGFTAWRNNFAATARAGEFKLPTAYLNQTTAAVPKLIPTLYNFAFTHALTENANVPQGAGYASITISTSGGYSYVGRTADGEGVTGAYWVGPTGQLFIFQTLYRTTPRGSLLGQLQFELGTVVDDNDISGSLDWVRPATPAATHRLYKAGFGLPGTPVITPIALTAMGGRFITQPVATGTVFGATAPRTANLEFSEDGEFSPAPADSDVNTATNPDLIGLNVKAGTKLDPLVITAGTKITPVHNTGVITGSGTLVDGALKRKLTFQGLMIRVRTSGLGIEPRVTDTYGTGYFILDQIPFGAEKPTTSPQRSGIFSFQD